MNNKKPDCGSCLHLDRERHFESVCATLGKLRTSRACHAYKPDMFKVVGSIPSMDRLFHLVDAIRGLSPHELEALGEVMKAERTTRKAGWSFMQKVYVRYAGTATRDYLNNFLVGWVVYADKEYVRVIGEGSGVFLTLMNEPDSTTLYSAARFRDLRRKMLEARKVDDPTSAFTGTRRVIQLDELATKEVRLRKGVRAGKVREDDLVSIVSRMSRGLIGRRNSRPENSHPQVRQKTAGSNSTGPSTEIVFSHAQVESDE